MPLPMIPAPDHHPSACHYFPCMRRMLCLCALFLLYHVPLPTLPTTHGLPSPPYSSPPPPTCLCVCLPMPPFTFFYHHPSLCSSPTGSPPSPPPLHTACLHHTQFYPVPQTCHHPTTHTCPYTHTVHYTTHTPAFGSSLMPLCPSPAFPATAFCYLVSCLSLKRFGISI